jgi:hypothetical protein
MATVKIGFRFVWWARPLAVTAMYAALPFVGVERALSAGVWVFMRGMRIVIS